MERQSHGFQYENYIIERNNLIKENKYTSKFDAYEDNIPVSIKCIKYKSSIDLGDMIRQVSIDSDFILYIGFWKDDKTNIVESHKVFITKDSWLSLFSNIPYISYMDNYVKNIITNSASDDEKWKSHLKLMKSEYGNGIIQPRFKRDHKTQRRLQCAISYKNFHNILTTFTKK